MQIKCEECGAGLTLSDDKIPMNQRIAVACPKCKNKIVLNNSRKEQRRANSDSHEKIISQPDNFDAENIKGQDGHGYGDDDTSLDFLEGDIQLALVMVTGLELSEKINQAVEDLGYKCVPAADSREAIGKMRLYKFGLVVLSDRFDGVEVERSPILRYLNNISMSIRRQMFVFLLSDNFKTMDQMMAFMLSVNLIVNIKETDRIGVIIKHAISDNEKFYKVMTDTLSEMRQV
jgi:predicted Zn finger-like uncharacterized protein